MAYSGLLATVNLYMMEESTLQARISGLMMDLTRASKQALEVGESYADKKDQINSYASQYSDYKDSREYQADLEDAKDEYNLEMARINEWETQLNTQKQMWETQLKVASQYKESFSSLLSEKAKKDSQYGGS